MTSEESDAQPGSGFHNHQVAKPSFEPRQSGSRNDDDLNGEIPQQTYSRTVQCAAHSHLWQKELLEIAVTLLLRDCRL